MQIACIVEPKENLNGAYRKVPVTFQNGGSSVTAGEIARQVNLLHEAWNEGRINAEEFVKRYLEIHPWRDGNGRTMWVVYNKIRLPDNGGMIYPQPVPEFSFT
jgi:fido (protein-threonine AMPylation protein)